MALSSKTLSGNDRLAKIAGGAPSLKMNVPDDTEAVQRVQLALKALTTKPMTKTFKAGADKPDGKYGAETNEACIEFQRAVFKSSPAGMGRAGRQENAEGAGRPAASIGQGQWAAQ